MNQQITASLEDYLETIYDLSEDNQVKPIDVSKKLDVSKASVTDAMKTLCEKGYVNYAPYKPISLTKTGMEKAKEVAQKHSMLKDFMQNVLKLEEEEAEINACKMEHILTSQAFEKIKEFMSETR